MRVYFEGWFCLVSGLSKYEEERAALLFSRGGQLPDCDGWSFNETLFRGVTWLGFAPPAWRGSNGRCAFDFWTNTGCWRRHR